MREIVSASGPVLSSSPPRASSPGIKKKSKSKKTSNRKDRLKVKNPHLPRLPLGHQPQLEENVVDDASDKQQHEGEEEAGFDLEDLVLVVATTEKTLLSGSAATDNANVAPSQLEQSPPRQQQQPQPHRHHHHHHHHKKNKGKTFSAWHDLLNHWRQRVRAKRQSLAQELEIEAEVVELFCNPEHDHGIVASSSSQLLSYLFVGGAEAAGDSEWLKANSITHVLNVAQEVTQISDLMYRELDIERRWIQILDHSEYDISQHFDEALDFVAKAKESEGRVLIHCAAGVSRSATIALASLMLLESMTLREALTLARERRPAIYPNKGFYEALFDFEDDLFRSTSLPRASLSLHEEYLA